MQKILLASDAETERAIPFDGSVAVDIQDATFTWQDSEKKESSTLSVALKSLNKALAEETPKDATDALANEEAVSALQNINLKVKCGELIGICGNVGSGKSALLHAIIGSVSDLCLITRVTLIILLRWCNAKARLLQEVAWLMHHKILGY